MATRSHTEAEFTRTELRRLEGDIKSVRSLLFEVKKSTLDPKEVREFCSALQQVKQGNARMEAVAKQTEETKVALENIQRQQREARQMFDSLPNKQQFKALKTFVDKQVHDEQDQQLRVQKQVEEMFERVSAKVQQELVEVRNLLQRSVQTLDQKQPREGLLTSRSMQDLIAGSMQDLQAGSMQNFSRELDPIKADMVSISQEVNKMRREHSAMLRSVEEASEEAKRAANEAAAAKGPGKDAQRKGLGKEAQSKISELESKTKGLDEMSKLQVQVESNQKDIFVLIKRLYDSGALIPPKPVDLPKEAVPVGTVELGEDIFSARLLIRLGLLKARSEQIEEYLEHKAVARTAHPMQSSYSGVVLMSVEPSEEEIYRKVGGIFGKFYPRLGGQCYWPCVARFGACRPWLVCCDGWIACDLHHNGAYTGLRSGPLIYYGMTTGSCLDPMHPISPIDWFILHFSKAVATISTGFFMGKDLMELSNYLMTSILLDIHIRPDVLLIAFLRVIFAISIGIANLVMFIGLTSPFEVWVNLTALGFVSEMGSHILDVAKRGFFGHHISKATCETNFSLNFMTEYPRWFGIAQFTTISLGVGFSVCFGALLFLAPDIYSDSQGFCPIEKQGIFAYLNTTHHHAENFVSPVLLKNMEEHGHRHHSHGH